METRIKQLDYQIDKKLEEMQSINKNQHINYELINGKDFDHLDVLFQFDNPLSIKGQIRDQQVILGNLERELSGLKMVVKGDNLMFLNNETVFNNKLLLTEKESLKAMSLKKDKIQFGQSKILLGGFRRKKELAILIDSLLEDISTKSEALIRLKKHDTSKKQKKNHINSENLKEL